MNEKVGRIIRPTFFVHAPLSDELTFPAHDRRDLAGAFMQMRQDGDVELDVLLPRGAPELFGLLERPGAGEALAARADKASTKLEPAIPDRIRPAAGSDRYWDLGDRLPSLRRAHDPRSAPGARAGGSGPE